jgi:hypothetical protein
MNARSYFRSLNIIIKCKVNHFFDIPFSFTVTSFLFIFSKRRGFRPGKKIWITLILRWMVTDTFHVHPASWKQLLFQPKMHTIHTYTNNIYIINTPTCFDTLISSSRIFKILIIPAHRQHQHRVRPSYTIIHPLCL